MDKLRTVELYRDDKRKIVAIEAVEFNHAKSKNSCQLYGVLTPIAIVVCTSEGKEVFSADAGTINLDRLKQIHLHLDEMIANACIGLM